MRIKVFLIFLIVVQVFILFGCSKGQQVSGVNAFSNFTQLNSNKLDNSKSTTCYTNPIDEYFLPKIENSSCEVELRDWQDEYFLVWSEEFEKLMKIMESKCIYQKDKDALKEYKDSIDNMIEKVSVVLVTEWLDDYIMLPDSPERGSWGNGTRSGLNMKKAEILRDESMLLIPYCDGYAYPKEFPPHSFQ